MKSSVLSAVLLAAGAWATQTPFYGIYYDQYHTQNLPNANQTADINHVFIAFVPSSALNSNPIGNYTPFASVSDVKAKFSSRTKVLISVGGWGDDGFSAAMANATSRALFAENVATMLKETGADGVDIDCEYPGGNGADYRQIPNDQKTSEITTFPLLLAAIRAAIGSKLLSIAVPGKAVDMIAYTPEQAPAIWKSVDFVNLMAYDFMNRRDNVTAHHTSVAESLAAVDRYLALGLAPAKLNLGFAFYAKWFTTANNSDCATHPLGCATALLENPDGSDTGLSGALTFERSNMVPTPVPTNLTLSPDGSCGPTSAGPYKCAAPNCCSGSGFCGVETPYCGSTCQHGYGSCTGESIVSKFQEALQGGIDDRVQGGRYFWKDDVFWTWDTAVFVGDKFAQIVKERNLGGVYAWSLGEDTNDGRLMAAMQKGVRGMKRV